MTEEEFRQAWQKGFNAIRRSMIRAVYDAYRLPWPAEVREIGPTPPPAPELEGGADD